MRAEFDRREGPVGIEDEELLSVGRGVVGLDVGRPRDRREPVAQARVREDRTAVRLPAPVWLDDIDRPRAGRVRTRCRDGRVRSEPEDVDHLARVVVHDLRARPREGMAAPVDGAVLGVVAPDREDMVGGRRGGAGRGEQLRVLQPGHLGEAVGAALHPDGGDDLDAGRIDERDAVAGRGCDPRDVLDLDAGQAPIGDRRLDLRARLTGAGVPEDDRLVDRGEVRLVLGGIPAEQFGEQRGLGGGVLQLVGVRDQRGAVAAVGEVREAGQVEPAGRCAGHEVEGLEVVARPDHDGRAVLRDVQQVHGRADLAEVCGRDAGRRGIRADRREAERGHAAVVEAGQELLATRVERQRADARCRDRRDQLAVAQVVAADLRPGRDVEAFARAAARQGRVIASGLDERRPHGHAEVAGGAHVVLAPGHDAERHRVLGQVGVGPLVDVVREPIPPVLEELRGRPGVVDLVEVHLVGLGQPERPEHQARDDQDGQDPQVQAVEATAALAAQCGASIRADGPLAKTVAEPADHAALGDAERPRPGRHRRGRDRRTGRDGGDAPGDDDGRGDGRGDEADRRHRARHSWALGRRGAAVIVGDQSIDLGLDRGTVQLIGQPVACAGPELERAPGEPQGVEQDHEGHARLRADRGADPQPVADRWVVGVQRREDDVHVRERRHAQDHVRDSPSRRDGGEDDAECEERVAVPLVDPGREDEEREREHRQPDEEREPVGFASDRPQDDEERSDEQGDPDRDGRDDAEDGAPGPALLGAQGRVADPLAGRGEAGARVREHERPRVVGVDGEVRVSPTGDEDLLDQPDRREPERDRQDDRGREAGDRGRQDPGRAPGPPVAIAIDRRPERVPDRHDRDQRDQDAELGLDERRDDRVDGRALGPAAPQLSQAQQQEHDTERVDLAPDDAVEPADRVGDRDERGRERETAPAAELEHHRMDQPADGEVGDERRDLDQVADAANDLPDEPDEPQDVQVAGRVVVEEVPLVEPPRAMVGEIGRPEPERAQVDAEAGSGEQVCDDEAEGEPEREDDHDRADGPAHPGRRRRRSCASLGPAGCGAGHRERLLHERGRWIGA